MPGRLPDEILRHDNWTRECENGHEKVGWKGGLHCWFCGELALTPAEVRQLAALEKSRD